jgi:NADH:ubiquinone oxidoreductase subunit 5 (subunit L)/multisubunit Na+/H+ antiporter MnhA subunit
MEILKILLSLILGLNIIGFIIGLFFSEKEQQERPLALFSFSVVLLIGLILILLLILHIGHLFPSYNIFLFQLMHGFSIDLLWNTTTLIFLMTGNIITLLILYFSSYYMHRENGFKRFFNTLMFFYMAYTITVLSGNFTTLFIGWEYLGISSFLLIGFYRDRYLPVRKYFYRISNR